MPHLSKWRLLTVIGATGWPVTIALLLLYLMNGSDPARPTIINSPVIKFSDQFWTPKSSQGLVGPGPNYFSPRNAYLDQSGRLHLKVDRSGGKWNSAELISTISHGYGKYSFTLGDLSGPLPSNVTMGFFTWDNDPEEFHREIDIELRRRIVDGIESSGAFTVQPWDKPGHVYKLDDALAKSFSFDWRSDSVVFESRNAANQLIDTWTFAGAEIPTPGNEKVRINLWLVGGKPPGDLKPIEVVIESFSFQRLEPTAMGKTP